MANLFPDLLMNYLIKKDSSYAELRILIRDYLRDVLPVGTDCVIDR